MLSHSIQLRQPLEPEQLDVLGNLIPTDAIVLLRLR
jgi:hypothetical protein